MIAQHLIYYNKQFKALKWLFVNISNTQAHKLRGQLHLE